MDDHEEGSEINKHWNDKMRKLFNLVHELFHDSNGGLILEIPKNGTAIFFCKESESEATGYVRGQNPIMFPYPACSAVAGYITEVMFANQGQARLHKCKYGTELAMLEHAILETKYSSGVPGGCNTGEEIKKLVKFPKPYKGKAHE